MQMRFIYNKINYSQMKKIFLILFVSWSCVSCANPIEPDLPVIDDDNSKKEVTVKDTLTYRAQVWIEKEDLARYGGERQFKSKLKEMFANTTRFWNESENTFKYYFRFVASEELHIYDIEGKKNRYDEFKSKAYGPLDTEKHDFVVFFALNANDSGLACGGGGASGHSIVMCYRTIEEEMRGDIFSATYPQLGMYSSLGHEYGHVRGATDMYQYIISASDNPVSGEALVPPKCNMGTGSWVWSEYCSYLFNYTAHQKQLDPDLLHQIFPDTLRIKVLVDRQPAAGLTLNFYGTRAGGSKNNRDVYPIAFKSFTTDADGCVNITDVYSLYHPEPGTPKLPPSDAFPYRYWFCFLVEATHRANKKYVWVPDWATQITKLKGFNTHEEIISF